MEDGASMVSVERDEWKSEGGAGTKRSPLTEGKHEMDGVARLVDIRE